VWSRIIFSLKLHTIAREKKLGKIVRLEMGTRYYWVIAMYRRAMIPLRPHTHLPTHTQLWGRNQGLEPARPVLYH
jgi:hypothetical protein